MNHLLTDNDSRGTVKALVHTAVALFQQTDIGRCVPCEVELP